MWRLCLTGACIVCASIPSIVTAQSEGKTTEPPRAVATRQDWFSIPFQIAPAGRPERQPVEVQLYVSDDEGRTWQLHDRVDPQAGQVSFQAPSDGRYCFCVRTRNRSGNLHPAGPLRPEMVVVVDTSSPQVKLTAARNADGAVTAQWQIEETHLDKNSLRLEYKVGAVDAPWQPLAADSPDAEFSGSVQSGSATWRPDLAFDVITVRASVRDVAGNRADHQALLDAVADPDRPGYAGRRDPAVVDEFGNMRRPSDMRLASDRSTQSLAEPSQAVERKPSQTPANDDADQRHAAAAGTHSATVANRHDRPLPGNRLDGAVVDPVHPPVAGQFAPLIGPSLTGSEDLPPGEHPRMVNSLLFELEYEVDSIGPTGIGRVQLWGTQDGGQTWRTFGVDADNLSPLPVTVDGEGLYGFRIVVESGSGLHGRLPQSGDAPEVWVGVDLSEPDVELISAEQGTGDQAGLLLVHWRADDAQLAVRPVSLLMRTESSGPWSPIASGLPDTGRFAWPLDNRVPDEIFLRLEVRDAAGNVRVVESDQTITLDRARPQGRIRGVRSLPSAASAQKPGWVENPYFR